jgi:hypothetical protein
LKPKLVRRDKECHYILIKGTINQESTMIVNKYAPNVSAPNFIKQTLLDIKAHIDSNTLIVGEYNIPLS